jgi:hypothetical protein
MRPGRLFNNLSTWSSLLGLTAAIALKHTVPVAAHATPTEARPDRGAIIAIILATLRNIEMGWSKKVL